MNEFNRNENEMNENKMNEEEVNKAEETAGTEPKNETAGFSGNDNTAADRTEPAPDAQPSVMEEAPADGSYSYTRENIPNRAFDTNTNAYRADPYSRPQPQPQQQNPYGTFAYGQQNPQGNPNGGYTSGGYRYNPGQGQPQNPNGYAYGGNGANPYSGGQFTNSYAPQNRSYYGGGMAQGDGSISYAPAADAKKKKKEKKSSGSVSRGALALVCCLTVAFSGVFGFAGTYLANNMNKTTATDANGNTVVNAGNTAVVYRTVEDIVTSTGAAVGEPLTYSQVADVVKDSVVEIMTEYTVQSMWYQYVTGGAGSGVIISDDGYIITNNHVICDDSGTTIADNITVRLTNGEEYKATAIGADADSDVAVLKIEAQGLTFAVAGNSDNLAVGEEVVVVGNPLGELGGTVTNGIVSATEREMEVNGVTMSLIQSNAAVNPGNSGGGMFNMKGELIGIVNAKSSGTGIEGLGFAIPINEALQINEQLLQYGYVRGKTMIGVSFNQVDNSASMFMYYYNMKPGLYVSSLSEGYNDDVLQVGDRVIAVNGEEVSTQADVKAIVTESSVGDKLKFQLYREGKLIEVEVTCFEKVPDGVEGSDIEFEKDKQP